MKLLTVHKENFINVVENVNDDLTANYADVFNKGLGTLPGKAGNSVLTTGLKT